MQKVYLKSEKQNKYWKHNNAAERQRIFDYLHKYENIAGTTIEQRTRVYV
jgi:hypothetical protein